MPKFNKKQLAMIALILDEEKNCNRTKKKWVRKMFTQRKFVGKFHTLFIELEDEEISFYKYFRMSQKAISPKEKLMVCLSYLAEIVHSKIVQMTFRNLSVMVKNPREIGSVITSVDYVSTSAPR
ncbi:protein ALP1-like, partial [Aphis craccivora]